MRPGWRPLSVLLGTAGVLHFVRPAPFASIVPRTLGNPYPWVYASGAAEIACAAAMTAPRSRRVGALAAAVLLLGVYPANVQMAVQAVRSPRASTSYRALALGRLPLQAPLVAWALRVAREERDHR